MTTEQRWQVVGYEKAGGFTQSFVMPEEFGEANRVVVRQMQNSQAVFKTCREPVNESV